MRQKFRIKLVTNVYDWYEDTSKGVLLINYNTKGCTGTTVQLNKVFGFNQGSGDKGLYEIVNTATRKRCYMLATKSEISCIRPSTSNPVLWDVVIENAHKFY